MLCYCSHSRSPERGGAHPESTVSHTGLDEEREDLDRASGRRPVTEVDAQHVPVLPGVNASQRVLVATSTWDRTML